MRLRTKIQFFLFKYGLYLVIFATLGIVAYFADRVTEAIFLVVSHGAIRAMFPKTWHANRFYTCIYWTIVVFSLLILNLTSLNVSRLSVVIVAMLLDFALYILQDYIECKAELKALKTKSLKEMSKEEFIKHCQHNGLDDNDIKIAELIVFQNLKGKEFYDAIGYSVSQAKRIRKRIKTKLNI